MEKLKTAELEELRAKWQSPETLLVLQRHMSEYARVGVITSYIECVDSSYPAEYGDKYTKIQQKLSSMARAELYLVATEMMEGYYFLERVNAETGFTLTISDNLSTRATHIPVVKPIYRGIKTRHLVKPFTASQAEIVTNSADELRSMGLDRTLEPCDIL